jgi:hypothetical protein
MVRYDFPSIIKGDTFNGVLFTLTLNTVPVDLTNAHINMDVRLTATGTLVKRYTSDASANITISATPTNGKFTFNQQIINIAAGNYKYDIEIELADGSIKTYVYGSFIVTQDVTYV